MLPDENIITVAPNVSVTRKCCLSRTVPIYEGYTLHHDILCLDLVGRDPAEYSMKNLTEQQYSFSAAAEREIVREIKEKPCSIVADYNTELKLTAECSDKEKTNALAEESIILVGAERFRYAEVSSRARYNGKEASGIHDTSLRCFMKCDVNIRKNLYADVVLSGGTTILQGIGKHMTNELTEKTYVLPDENIVTVGTERFRRVKTLFQPVSLARWFYDTSFQIIMKCDVDIRTESHANVVLSSGTTCSKRFFMNMTKELTALSHPR